MTAQNRRAVKSPAAMDRLLDDIAGGETLDDAAAHIGVTRGTVHRWRRDDADFRAALDIAYEVSTDVLEKEARARALDRQDRSSAMLLKYLITGRRERWSSVAAPEKTRSTFDRFELVRRLFEADEALEAEAAPPEVTESD
jgi:hypothetical protein